MKSTKKMTFSKWTLLLVVPFFLGSCVSSKKFDALQTKLDDTEMMLKSKLLQLSKCEEDLAMKEKKCKEDLQNAKSSKESLAAELNKELDFYKRNNETLLNHLSDLSNLNKTEALNLRKTLEELSEQRKHIKSLNEGMRKRDSVSLALVTNLKRSLGDINDDDVNIEVRKGVVYISISDKLLFRSGSAKISSNAQAVLGKVAKVLNDHKDIDIMVEGHTDNVPMNKGCIQDNWDLSVQRAAEVVRTLQKKHNVAPERMTAAGRSEYMPKASNDSADGRKRNRRTEIVITPKLNQYFNLLKS